MALLLGHDSCIGTTFTAAGTAETDGYNLKGSRSLLGLRVFDSRIWPSKHLLMWHVEASLKEVDARGVVQQSLTIWSRRTSLRS
jgi:hypothetical protein